MKVGFWKDALVLLWLYDEALTDDCGSKASSSGMKSKIYLAAATALAERHANGFLPVEDFNIELEDQSGQKVNFGSETDQKAIMMGLMLHANAKQLIRKGNYKDALEVLVMGEEAFTLCNPKLIEFVDNVSILQIDMVWCYFMLKDIKWLSDAGLRLAKAREGIERAHGKDSSRVRMLQAGCHPELALHLRLELLEGVAAYHSCKFDKAREAINSARAKYFQLQVSDEALSHVMDMGFKEKEAKRALRMCHQDVCKAVDFLFEERTKRERKREEDIRRQEEIMEQKLYGMTPSKKAVNLQILEKLTSIGYEKELAAEALRRNENDIQKALDDLISPESNSVIQNAIESRKRKRQRKRVDGAVDKLVRMGFDKTRAEAAFEAGGSLEQALIILSEPGTNTAVHGQPDSVNAVLASEGASSSLSNIAENQEMLDTLDDEGGPSIGEEDRDSVMEDELARELNGATAVSDYDMDVTKEGEAITEYLGLLDSMMNSENA
ncbi:NEDD8 ultimate buster 1 [Cucumis melo var. makuwa]|uniref:NEDD8 ultimate buster 1 n=1 Tax=Cucumis melo var. makuwa TaxID=1194695 RepID=A0A5D3BFD3_CUCMM|nr:NEDD8 ultimate buster 1 [Cucumis melo var. makuwa]TYJ97837.1 NEDD8 ultimate buster 1 [Cucumis melo var. makuwa]